MINYDRFTKVNRHSGSILILLDEANTLIVNACKIQTCVRIIEQSCSTPGTKVARHKELLLNKANDLKKSVMLHLSAAKRLKVAVNRLLNGESEGEVMAGIRTYNTFLADQLKSANNDVSNINAMLSQEISG